MTSDVMTAPQNRVYLSIPKKYIKGLSETLNLEHGLLITELNPMINEGYVQTYFKNLGFNSRCKMLKFRNAGKCVPVAYVRLATEDEADRADWAGPHFIGGTEVVIRRVVCPKVNGNQIKDESEDEIEGGSSKRPLRSVGLGYVLEDPQWLGEEDTCNEDAV